MQASIVLPLVKELKVDELLKLQKELDAVIMQAQPNAKKIMPKKYILTEAQAIENIFKKGILKR